MKNRGMWDIKCPCCGKWFTRFYIETPKICPSCYWGEKIINTEVINSLKISFN